MGSAGFARKWALPPLHTCERIPMPYQIPEWDEYQQYRDREPKWIKLHRKLLDNRKFQNLPLAARAMLPMLWLLASENKDYMSGIIAMANDDICFRLRVSETELVKCLDVLLSQGFLNIVHSDTETYKNVPRDREETEERRGERVTLESLSVEHIKDWLSEKRSAGIYKDHDEHAILEGFKDYCRSKGKKYTDYPAALRNAFQWERFAPQKKKSRVGEVVV